MKDCEPIISAIITGDIESDDSNLLGIEYIMWVYICNHNFLIDFFI